MPVFIPLCILGGYLNFKTKVSVQRGCIFISVVFNKVCPFKDIEQNISMLGISGQGEWNVDPENPGIRQITSVFSDISPSRQYVSI